MKAIATTIAAAICVMTVTATASPHNHRHMHAHYNKKRVAKPDTQVVTVPGGAEVVYQFEGSTITESEVCKGILNGTFVWAEGTADKPDCSALNAAPPAPSPVPVKQDIKQDTKQDDPPAPKSESKISVPNANKGGDDSKSAPVSSQGGSGDSSTVSGDGDCDKDFADGEHDCSEFPEQYGAVKIPWMNMGGWAGVQFTSVANGVVGKIDTAISGGGCKAGAYCSYACPPGYQKSQWPEQQSGTSVGGLQCDSNGKLRLSNPAFKQICIPGTGKTQVQNKLSGKNVAICRTDYPGKFNPHAPSSTFARFGRYPTAVLSRATIPCFLVRCPCATFTCSFMFPSHPPVSIIPTRLCEIARSLAILSLRFHQRFHPPPRSHRRTMITLHMILILA